MPGRIFFSGVWSPGRFRLFFIGLKHGSAAGDYILPEGGTRKRNGIIIPPHIFALGLFLIKQSR